MVLAFYNIKGGVGKTTSAVNLAYCVAASGRSVLLVDLDPQASASYYFRVSSNKKYNVKKMLKGGKHIDGNIKATNYAGLDILPADFSYRKMDLKLDDEKHSKSRLSTLLGPLSHEYATIVLDCPPNITLESENVFRAADFLLVPTIPSALSMHTYETLLTYLARMEFDPDHVLPFFNLVDRRRRLHKEVIEQLRDSRAPFLSTEVPYSADVEKMGAAREPVVAGLRSSRAAVAFNSLWTELEPIVFRREEAADQ